MYKSIKLMKSSVNHSRRHFALEWESTNRSNWREGGLEGECSCMQKSVRERAEGEQTLIEDLGERERAGSVRA